MSLIPKKGNVYVVDDDEAVRDSLQWLLEGKDYRVKCYDSAESFLSRYDPREVATCLRSTWPPVELFVIECGSFTESQIADALCTFREWKKEMGKELTRRARVRAKRLRALPTKTVC